MAKPRDAFEVKLPADTRERLGIWLCDELQNGLNARSSQEREVDYWHQLYEQARTRRGNEPWPDAADLTSYLPSEKVDALHARLMKSVWSDPICTVEGWGAAADRAPIVEEFHQWKAEEERLQSVMDRLAQISLIEPRGLLEIAEGTDFRTVRKTIRAAVETHPETGGPIYDDQGNPILQTNEDGTYVEAQDDNQMSAETVIDSRERVRTGPVYRILPYRDSCILPGHARDKDEIYGYFKRFWRRADEIRAKAKQGVYDKDAVEKMPPISEREPNAALQRSLMDVAPTERGQSPLELWEGVILTDLESFAEAFDLPKGGKELRGERWYLVTIHLGSMSLLRVQHDDLERSRFVPVLLFPRPDRVTEGFSFVGHKLITVTEEHTAWRNMAADRGHMANSAPIKRVQGALWDPMEQPWGPRAIIDVRDPREVEPFQIPDVPVSVMNHIQMMERTAERLAGINDVASGQVATENRTLGEVQMATEQSFVRMDLVVRRFQEAMEDIWQIRHAIWKRTLAEKPDGESAPAMMLNNLEGRGTSIDQYLPEKKVTAAMLDGAFRFKPFGSVQDADPNARRNKFAGFAQTVGTLMQMFPYIAQSMQTPRAQRFLLRWFMQAFGQRQAQAVLGSPSQDMAMQGMLNMAPPAMPMPPMMPGMGGMPGMPGMSAPPMGMEEPQGLPPAA